MDSKSIIKAIAKTNNCHESQVIKLMDVPDTYQLGTKRLMAISNDELPDRVKENLMHTMHDVYRDMGMNEFLRCSNIHTISSKEKEILKIIVNYGKDGNLFLLGLVKDINSFCTEMGYSLGYWTAMGAEFAYSIMANNIAMQVFVLKGDFPLVEPELLNIKVDMSPFAIPF